MKTIFVVNENQPILKGHVLHGKNVLPGLAYIDLIYQLFRSHGHDFATLELRNLTIYKPLMVSAAVNVVLEIDCTQAGANWTVNIHGTEQGALAADGGRMLYVSAEMHTVAAVSFNETLDITATRRIASQQRDLAQAYEKCRARELVHSGLMQAEGMVYDTDQEIVADLSVCADAKADAGKSMFHPALIDGSGIAMIGIQALHASGADERLSVPLFYESFQASTLLQSQCITRIRKQTLRQQGEISSLTMEFFDLSGRKVAELRNCAAKLIRNPGLIDPARVMAMPANADARLSADKLPFEWMDEMPASDGSLDANIQNLLRKLVAQRLSQSMDDIKTSIGYYEMGLASADLMSLVGELNSRADLALAPTLLFEYPNIQELSAYLAEAHPMEFARCFTGSHGVAPVDQDLPQTASVEARPLEQHDAIDIDKLRLAFGTNSDTSPPVRRPAATANEEIAIIGLSGRYPQARDVNTFWNNLKAGRDCITEIPADRWNLDGRSGASTGGSKWGGFIDGVDQFDLAFFNISMREAEYMDPQERLFLQCTYEAMEDAGYSRETLAASTDSANVGVFVGVMYEEYQLYGAQEQAKGRPMAVSGSAASVANRVSYFNNFHGPSMAVDTMCSSSLTAVHLACQNLQTGSCDVAIAGGVNVSIHPNKYIMLGQNGFVSSKGRCESFGEGGDGYIPSEGVGAVLLKPLSKAIADGDHIYGVIKGAALNHGGKANGYTVPNPNAQADVIARALKASGLDARAISYIEAHGTGTSLGDPIEIAGLSKAFSLHTQDKQFCAIGSAKSNIGHCEGAAGIAGITKVLMQMKHKQLAPSLHSSVLNPHIDFANSPFVVQQALTDWMRPILTIDGKEQEGPRIAGVASFGAGGSNAYVLIEEYVDTRVAKHGPVSVSQPALIVLSARNADQLQQQARRLLEALRGGMLGDVDLAELAYTLQVGRAAMEERLAMTATSQSHLENKLAAFVAGDTDIDELYCGQISRNQETVRLFAMDEELHEAVGKWIERKKYRRLLGMWVKGLVINWHKLYGARLPRRMSLPTYPFASQRCWMFPSALLRDHGLASPAPHAAAAMPAFPHTSLLPQLTEAVDMPEAMEIPETLPTPEPVLASASLVEPDAAAVELPTVELLLSLPVPQASRRIVMGLARMIAETRRMDISAQLFDPDDFVELPISSLDVDSVSAMELRARIRAWLDVDLPSHLLIGTSSIGEVAETIYQKVLMRQLNAGEHSDDAETEPNEEVLML